MSENTKLAGKILLMASQTISEISSLLLMWPDEEKQPDQTKKEIQSENK